MRRRKKVENEQGGFGFDKMPENCDDCQLLITDYEVGEYCAAVDPKESFVHDRFKRPDFCPLRPLPEKRNQPAEELKNMPYADGVQQGFNLCLRAIEGSGKRKDDQK